MVFNTIEEAQRSTDPAKLFRAMRACSTDAHREVALGFTAELTCQGCAPFTMPTAFPELWRLYPL